MSNQGTNDGNNISYPDVYNWLNNIGLTQYYDNLINEGYESIDDIKTITDKDLDGLNIKKQMHLKKILKNIKILNQETVTVTETIVVSNDTDDVTTDDRDSNDNNNKKDTNDDDVDVGNNDVVKVDIVKDDVVENVQVQVNIMDNIDSINNNSNDVNNATINDIQTNNSNDTDNIDEKKDDNTAVSSTNYKNESSSIDKTESKSNDNTNDSKSIPSEVKNGESNNDTIEKTVESTHNAAILINIQKDEVSTHDSKDILIKRDSLQKRASLSSEKINIHQKDNNNDNNNENEDTIIEEEKGGGNTEATTTDETRQLIAPQIDAELNDANIEMVNLEEKQFRFDKLELNDDIKFDDNNSDTQGRLMSDRVSVLTPVKYKRRRSSFDITRGELPLLGCIRACTHFYLRKNKGNIYFSATASSPNLIIGFAFIPTMGSKYKIVELKNGCYIGVKKILKNDNEYKVLTLMNMDELNEPKRKKEIKFTIETTRNDKTLFTIKWKKLYLTVNEQTGFVYFADNNAKNSKYQSFGITNTQQTDQDKITEQEMLNVRHNLDLVNEQRDSYVGVYLQELQTNHLSKKLIDLIERIFKRFDEHMLGYALFGDIWTNFIQYTNDFLIPSLVVQNIEKYITVDDMNKLIHIRKFVITLDVIWEFFDSEIKVRQKLLEEEMEKAKNAPISIKLRRLDDDILILHPNKVKWNNLTEWQKWVFDWKLWLKMKYNTGSNGFFLWRKHLLSIQSNFGESIYAFFSFARWIFVLNFIMGITFLLLIIPHVWNMDYVNLTFTDVMNMLVGNEFVIGPYYYGSYVDQYNFLLKYSIKYMWIVVCGISITVWVLAILTKIISELSDTDDDNDFVFASQTLGKYNFNLKHIDAIKLEQNSIMIRLHERLLESLDEIINEINYKIIFRRIFGVLLSITVALAAAALIVILIQFEERIEPLAAEALGSIGEFMGSFIVPAGVSMIKIISPKIVAFIVKLERYTAQYQFQQTFFRAFLLRMFAVLVTLFQTSVQAQAIEQEDLEQSTSQTITYKCAENQIGSILFKFILFDMILEIFFSTNITTNKIFCI